MVQLVSSSINAKITDNTYILTKTVTDFVGPRALFCINKNRKNILLCTFYKICDCMNTCLRPLSGARMGPRQVRAPECKLHYLHSKPSATTKECARKRPACGTVHILIN